MIWGYARVSTLTQGRDGNSLEEQVSALTAYGCQEIVQEAFTGKTMDRPVNIPGAFEHRVRPS